MPNILIVEDDEAIRAVLSELVLEEGYRVVSVPHGAAALAHLEMLALEGDLPTLILLDLQIATHPAEVGEGVVA